MRQLGFVTMRNQQYGATRNRMGEPEISCRKRKGLQVFLQDTHTAALGQFKGTINCVLVTRQLLFPFFFSSYSYEALAPSSLAILYLGSY